MKKNWFHQFCFFRLKELSPNHTGAYSLDSQGYVDLRGQEIKHLGRVHKFIKCDFSNSSFMASNAIYWIKGKTFIDSTFSKTTFNALAEHGNKFYNCSFENINFKNAILGYDSSCYTNCTFKKVKFGAFIKPQFKYCKFIDCDFYNVDFQASSFEHCEFVGKLENVWFRGGFPTDSQKKEFGDAKPNRMINVSFENATLHDVTFSDNCDLSTIALPRQGQYLFFDNWNEQLNTILAKGTTNQPVKTSNDITSFVALYNVHSANQKYYILNIADLLRDYSENAVEIIQQNAKKEDTMNYFLMGLKHFKNVAIACAPDNVGLAHELIGTLSELEAMPFDFNLKALTVKSNGIHYSNDFSLVEHVWLDYQPNNLAWPLFSEKLKNLIETALTGREKLKWISCNICYKNEIRKYYIPYFTEGLDVLNKEKSFYANNGNLIKPAFSYRKIQDYSIFPKPSMNNLWQITAAICISDKVKKEIMKSKILCLNYEAILIV